MSSRLPGFAATRLVVQGPGKLATKQIRRGGVLEKIDYSDGAKWWRMSPFEAANHGAMAVELEKLATMPQSLLVMGDCVPGLDLALEHRRRWAASEPLENTLRAVPRAWMAIDADDASVPAPLAMPNVSWRAPSMCATTSCPPSSPTRRCSSHRLRAVACGARRYFAAACGFCSPGRSRSPISAPGRWA